MREVRHVDPTRRRGWSYRTYARLAASPAALWFSRRVAWRADPWIMRVTRGRVGTGLVLPTCVLGTTGARTGVPRSNVVIYFHDGLDVIVVASKAGMPQHPGWFHNLRAWPDVTVNDRPFRATVVEDHHDRDRLWRLADLVFPPFASYRRTAASAGRTIPIVRLSAR